MLVKKLVTPFFLGLMGAIVLPGCTQVNVFEKNIGIPHYEWKSDFVASDGFTINDTTSFYNIYVVLRHTDAYKYNNIWLNIGFQAPGDSLFTEKKEIMLGSDATGWLGSGMDDIWEIRQQLNDTPKRFKKTGKYRFFINQIMRDNPLLHIMSIGLRVQKVEQ